MRTKATLGLVVFWFILPLVGCGGGGGGEEAVTGAPSVAAYESWLKDTLAGQKTIVQSSVASFVDPTKSDTSDILTNLVGWVRVDGSSNVDPMKRWSNSPDEVGALVASSTDVIASAGRSFALAGNFKRDTGVGLSIPVISAVISLANTKHLESSFTIAISYEDAHTYWIGDRAMNDLLKRGNFSNEFLTKVEAGQVRVYQGAVALRNVHIKLSRSVASNFKLGDTFKDNKSGLSLTVTGEGSSSSDGSVELTVAGEMYVGISARYLTPADLGLAVSSGVSEAGGVKISYGGSITRSTGQGSTWVRNDSSELLHGFSFIQTVQSSYAPSSPSTLWMSDRSTESDLASGETRRLTFTSLPLDASKSQVDVKPIILRLSSTNTRGNPYTGIYSGAIFKSDSSGLGPKIDVSGYIGVDGKLVLASNEGTILLDGRIDKDGGFDLNSRLFSNAATGTASREERLVRMDLYEDYKLQISLPPSTSTD